MKQININHEILLFTGTGLTNREFCSRDEERDNGRKTSPLEALEKSCWDGLLHELLPELVGRPSAKTESFIWQIMPGNHFLRINMGSSPEMIEYETSIDPYFFINDSLKN